jgi:hypothetical protein
MKLYVVVNGFQLCIESISAYTTREAAIANLDTYLKDSGYTGEKWLNELEETSQYPLDKYEPTRLDEVEIPFDNIVEAMMREQSV